MTKRNNPSGQRKLPQYRLPLHVYLLYLLVVSFLLTGMSLSRYVTATSGGDTARVAGTAVSTQVTQGNGSIALTQPGATAGYSFSVTNSRGGTISQVALQYDVIVEVGEPLPAGVELRLDGKTGQLDPEGKTYTFVDVGTFGAGNEDTHPHTLTFAATDVLDEVVSINVTVSVRAEQID